MLNRSLVLMIQGPSIEPLERFAIGPGIVVGSYRGSEFKRLHQDFCVHTPIDEGDPFEYDIYIQMNEPLDTGNFPLDPNSPVANALNLFAIVLATPLGMCRLMSSIDDFRSVEDTNILFHYRPLIAEWAGPNPTPITTTTCETLARCWASSSNAGRRLSDALTFFRHAWLAHDVDQACLNLAICLEVLCAPHVHAETTHQISFNAAHLSAGDGATKRRTYTFVRSFYGFRSAIVHGGETDMDKLQQLIPEAFALVAGLLRRVLLSDDLAQRLEDEVQRRALFLGFMFPE